MDDEQFDRLCQAHSFGAVARGELPLVPRGMLKALVEAAVSEERERWAADARLAAYVRQRAEESSDGWRIDVWINGAPSLETIDDALRA